MSIAVDPPAAPGTELSVRSYSGATRRFTVGRLWGSHYNFAAGRRFSLVPNGYSTDPNEKRYSYASPALNPLVAPLFAFVYWHRKVVLGDAAGAAVHRDRHDAVFTGQTSAWMGLGTQKERNQSVFWSTDGLAYRACGDAGTGYTSVYGTVIKGGGPSPSPSRRPSPSPAS
jgi:hypothetical protein